MDSNGNDGPVGFSYECEQRVLDIRVNSNNPANVDLGITENSILEFDVGYASHEGYIWAIVRPSSNVQFIAGSINIFHVYPQALSEGDLISDNDMWVTGDPSYVLASNVGTGLFRGAGKKYLGFRVLDDGNTYYGWIPLDVSNSISPYSVGEYRINYNPGEFIEAGVE